MANQTDFLLDAGEAILDGVVNAVSTGDFSHLSKDIGIVVQQTTDGIRSTIKNPKDVYTASRVVEPDSGDAQPQGAGSYSAPRTTVNRAMRVGGTQKGSPAAVRYGSHQGFMANAPGRSAGIGRMVVGGLGCLFFGIPTIATAIVGAVFSPFAWIATGICGAFTAASAALLAGGSNQNKLIGRLYRYGEAVGDSEYVKYSDLALKAAYPESLVRSDILKLRRQGILKNVTSDKSDTTLMLSDRAYKEYLDLEARKNAYEAEHAEELAAAKQEAMKLEAEDMLLPEDAQSILKEGQAYMLKVRDYNDMIPDTEIMSDKLYQLENIMKRIFDQVRAVPASSKELRRFMNYYLPTTEKLLGAYIEAQKAGNGENPKKTRVEIEKALDMINKAFEQLLDRMFETKAWDVSSDISVMQTMMAQDGLA